MFARLAYDCPRKTLIGWLRLTCLLLSVRLITFAAFSWLACARKLLIHATDIESGPKKKTQIPRAVTRPGVGIESHHKGQAWDAKTSLESDSPRMVEDTPGHGICLGEILPFAPHYIEIDDGIWWNLFAGFVVQIVEPETCAGPKVMEKSLIPQGGDRCWRPPCRGAGGLRWVH